MIFNTWAYYLFFLVPSAILFRLSPLRFRPWVIVAGGSAFFLYFSYTELGGIIPAACLGIFLWESITSRFYRPKSWFCWVGVAQAIVLLFIFKYWNFFAGLVWFRAPEQHYWAHAFLPLGISFFTFEFIHYATDRFKNRTEAGNVGEYLEFILFFPTMVAGPIKRCQQFLPKLRSEPLSWPNNWHRGVTRILAGLAKKFAIADVKTAYTNHLNHADLAVAKRAMLPVWLLAYGIKIYTDFSAYSDIAIGSAWLFGIPIPENFDWPYLQTNITRRVASEARPRLRQHPDDHAGERNLARRGNQFCAVGPVAWGAVGDSSRVEKIPATPGKSIMVVAIRGVVDNICGGESRLGLFLHGRAYGAVLLQALVAGVIR
jgi:alginate O-acetyltransferase complex protein AlgI